MPPLDLTNSLPAVRPSHLLACDPDVEERMPTLAEGVGAESSDPDQSLDRPRRHRADGWTPDRIRTFLTTLAQCGVVSDAARAAGMSAQGAYAFRNSARGRTFDIAWRAALVLARRRIADEVMSRALNGCVEVIMRDGVVWGERHRYDNRLTMAVLARLDDLANDSTQAEEIPCKVAHEFDCFVDAVCAGGDEAADFIRSRAAMTYYDFNESAVLERNEDYVFERDETEFPEGE